MRLLLPLLALLSGAAGYRYLVVFPMPSSSHGILGKGVVSSLVDAGHEVTYITSFPEKDPMKGVQQINATFMFEIMHSMPNFFQSEPSSASNNMKQMLTTLKEIGLNFNLYLLKNEIIQTFMKDLRAMPNFFKGEKSMTFTQIKEFAFNISVFLVQNEGVQDFMKDKRQKFDAVITEWFFSDLYTGFAEVFQCPWILLSPVGMTSSMEYLIDEVQSPATNPNIVTGYTVPMSLKERLVNSFLVFVGLFQTIYIDHPKESLAYHQYFGPAAKARGLELREYADVVHDVAILFLNSHHSLAQALRLPPNAIEIGGYHIDPETKPLPKDLQDLLDNASNGVVYFSMGSNLKSKDMPESMRAELLRMFGRLPYTVLWKFEAEMKNAPKNVHVRPWMPQQSILAHKNIKVFITHGGLLSTTEATHFGVPVISIPVFGDQFVNAQRSEKRGIGLTVQLNDPELVTSLEKSIKTIIGNSRYGETAQRLSTLLRDRPIPPARLLSYWAEYVVRTSGAPQLRTAARKVPAYQRYLLDIFAILASVILLFTWILRAIYRLLFRRKCGSSSTIASSTTSKKKKKN